MPETTAPLSWSSLSQYRDTIVDSWAATAADSSSGRMTRRELDNDVGELFDAIVAAVKGGQHQAEDDAFADVRFLLTDLARTRARQGFTPSETANGVFAVKGAMLGLLRQRDDPADYVFYAEFTSLIDDLGLFTLDTYAQARESVIAEQADTLLELSTPVVKLWDGIVCLPLVGTLDSARTQVVMEKLLQALVDTGSAQAIIDITGVSAVDTQVAQHLLKTVMAARLLGAECIISGIRPQIAQTVVALGIEFGDISTKAALADALLLALRRSGSDVVRRPVRQER